jgi:hypothetical protein
VPSWRDASSRWPLADCIGSTGQVGVVPAECGCVVVDLDEKNGVSGRETLFKRFRCLVPSLSYRTLSGGWHLWYRVPPDAVIPQRNGSMPGVDVRHADGYACVGEGYLVYDVAGIAECPPPLLAWLTSAPKAPRRPPVEPVRDVRPTGRYDLSPIPEGRRNDTLYRWGFGLLNGVAKGELSLSDLEDLVMARGLNSGLPRHECESVFGSLMRNVRI